MEKAKNKDRCFKPIYTTANYFWTFINVLSFLLVQKRNKKKDRLIQNNRKAMPYRKYFNKNLAVKIPLKNKAKKYYVLLLNKKINYN